MTFREKLEALSPSEWENEKVHIKAIVDQDELAVKILKAAEPEMTIK